MCIDDYHNVIHNYQVTRDDLNRIGRMMLDSKVAVAAIGTLKKLPSYSDIEIGLLDKDVRINNKKYTNTHYWKFFRGLYLPEESFSFSDES